MKNSLFKSSAVIFTACSIIMTGCSKSGNSDSDTQKSEQPSLSGALSPAGQKAAVIAALPKANADTPLTQFVPLTSGNQLMFMYYGLSNMPVDYEKIAQSYSQEYRSTSDVFKQKDILSALKPRIDNEIASSKTNRYFMIENSASVSNYDLTAKNFTLNDSLLSEGTYGYFNDNGGYKYSFTNGSDFKNLKVTDEGKARQIESLVNKYPPMKIVYYAYAQDADPSNLTVKAQIVKVRLLDSQGNELMVQ